MSSSNLNTFALSLALLLLLLLAPLNQASSCYPVIERSIATLGLGGKPVATKPIRFSIKQQSSWTFSYFVYIHSKDPKQEMANTLSLAKFKGKGFKDFSYGQRFTFMKATDKNKNKFWISAEFISRGAYNLYFHKPDQKLKLQLFKVNSFRYVFFTFSTSGNTLLFTIKLGSRDQVYRLSLQSFDLANF